MTSEPHEYPKRILLAAAGLSPQVVTETLYALAVAYPQPFVPTAVHLLTTAAGAERARLSLLSEDPGWFRRFCQEYDVKAVELAEDNIHVMRRPGGELVPDIRSEEDNRLAADWITEMVRRFTADSESAVHVSIAGGRKTMGFFLGYALSLYGRPQDRLSHVLVSAPFESHPDFYFPTRKRRIIYTPPPESRPLDTSTAEVTLASIPLVRLREGLPERLLNGRSSYIETVAAAQRILTTAELLLDLAGGTIRAGGFVLPLPPADLAFYSWLARRRLTGRGPVECPSDGAPESQYAREFLAEYTFVVGELGANERTLLALRHGMDKAYFLERKSRANSALRQALGSQARVYLVTGVGRRPNTSYGLLLDSQKIRYRDLSSETGTGYSGMTNEHRGGKAR